MHERQKRSNQTSQHNTEDKIRSHQQLPSPATSQNMVPTRQLTPANILTMQRTRGNRFVRRMIASVRRISPQPAGVVQRSEAGLAALDAAKMATDEMKASGSAAFSGATEAANDSQSALAGANKAGINVSSINMLNMAAGANIGAAKSDLQSEMAKNQNQEGDDGRPPYMDAR